VYFPQGFCSSYPPFGRGDVLGRFVPPQYDPSATGTFPTSGKIHELSLNLGAKVLF
jgi:hypothetical protein